MFLHFSDHGFRRNYLQLVAESAAPSEEGGADLDGGGEGDFAIAQIGDGCFFAEAVVDYIQEGGVRFKGDKDWIAAEHGESLLAMFGDVQRFGGAASLTGSSVTLTSSILSMR